jgi:hypothetical protein
MIARTLALLASLALICLLGFLTIAVALDHGFDVLVIISLAVLALLAFGVLGALTSPGDD